MFYFSNTFKGLKFTCTRLTCAFILMSDSGYIASAKFLDIVDSDWVLDILPFEDILVNVEVLPSSEPELGCLTELEQAAANEKAWTEINLEALLLPRPPTTDPSLSNRYLPLL